MAGAGTRSIGGRLGLADLFAVHQATRTMKIGCGRAAATGCAEQKCAGSAATQVLSRKSVREAGLPRTFCAKSCGKLGCQRLLCAKERGKLGCQRLLCAKERGKLGCQRPFCAKACGKLGCQRPLCAKSCGKLGCHARFARKNVLAALPGRKKQNRSVWEALPQQDGRFTRS